MSNDGLWGEQPRDIRVLVARLLDLPSLAALSRASKGLNEFCSSDDVWVHFYFKEWHILPFSTPHFIEALRLPNPIISCRGPFSSPLVFLVPHSQWPLDIHGLALLSSIRQSP